MLNVKIRSKFLKFLIFIMVTMALVLFFYIRKQVTKRMNVVLISIDTLRPDHMGVYGYSKNTTPNIDTFAKNATVFTNVVTTVPMTYPSFAAFLTGTHPLHSRITTNIYSPALSDNLKTFPEVLKENGYMTAAFTTGALSPATNFFKGFDTYKFLGYKYPIWGTKHYVTREREPYIQLINNSLDWLADHKNNTFFLWIHLLDPHAPYDAPNAQQCQTNQELCQTLQNSSDESFEEERGQYSFCRANPLPQDTVELFKSLYDNGITYSDSLAQKMISAIHKNGLDNNTMIVLYGDHGEGFDHNYYFDHRGVIYNSAIKIPLIIKDPHSVVTGKKNQFIDNTDIFPTILDLLSIKNPVKVDGISFASLFHRIPNIFAPKRKSTILLNNVVTKYGLYDGKYKYIYSLHESCLNDNQFEEMYDTVKDPQELKNLASTPQAKSLRKELFSTLAPYNLPYKEKDSSVNETITPVPLPTLNFNPNYAY